MYIKRVLIYKEKREKYDEHLCQKFAIAELNIFFGHSHAPLKTTARLLCFVNMMFLSQLINIFYDTAITRAGFYTNRYASFVETS